jgi:hypothetical protein
MGLDQGALLPQKEKPTNYKPLDKDMLILDFFHMSMTVKRWLVCLQLEGACNWTVAELSSIRRFDPNDERSPAAVRCCIIDVATLAFFLFVSQRILTELHLLCSGHG